MDVANDRVTLRETVAAQRIARGLSQRALARAAGIQPHQISRYERGVCDLYGATLDRLMAALGLKIVKDSPGGKA